MADVTHAYWKSGDGDPYNGGRFGVDTTTTIGSISTEASQGRPGDAVGITQAEYDALYAAFVAEWDARAVGGQAFVDAEIAAHIVLRDAAVTKLVSGDPLTVDEAAAIAGGA